MSVSVRYRPPQTVPSGTQRARCDAAYVVSLATGVAQLGQQLARVQYLDAERFGLPSQLPVGGDKCTLLVEGSSPDQRVLRVLRWVASLQGLDWRSATTEACLAELGDIEDERSGGDDARQVNESLQLGSPARVSDLRQRLCAWG